MAEQQQHSEPQFHPDLGRKRDLAPLTLADGLKQWLEQFYGLWEDDTFFDRMRWRPQEAHMGEMQRIQAGLDALRVLSEELLEKPDKFARAARFDFSGGHLTPDIAQLREGMPYTHSTVEVHLTDSHSTFIPPGESRDQLILQLDEMIEYHHEQVPQPLTLQREIELVIEAWQNHVEEQRRKGPEAGREAQLKLNQVVAAHASIPLESITIAHADVSYDPRKGRPVAYRSAGIALTRYLAELRVDALSYPGGKRFYRPLVKFDLNSGNEGQMSSALYYELVNAAEKFLHP